MLQSSNSSDLGSDRSARSNNLPVLQRGSTVGRYVILKVIGSGGIGTVYAAYDPKLERKVAIKILQPGQSSIPSEELRRGLMKEAQAMARLSHPNVVAIHDVGTLGTNVFIAMEYVRGLTLRSWLLQKRPPIREILDVFTQAGRGLAAAHDAGIIHRDFKPENVLVKEDGAVRVTDFGLARALHPDRPQSMLEGLRFDDDAEAPSLGDSSDLSTFGPVGTPGYMPLEQLDGKSADARADQFSFCVTLYEALYCHLPFKGPTLVELVRNLRAGQVRDAPKDSHVPQWVRRVLLRGLSRDPNHRYPSMEALLRALAPRPRLCWNRAAVAFALVAVVGAVGWSYRSVRTSPRELCRAGDRQLKGVWDSAVKGTVRNGILRSGESYASSTLKTVESALDAYAQDWVRAYADACEATRVRAEQPEVVFSQRRQCFDYRLQQVRALTQLFSRADPEVVENAARAASTLPSLQSCTRISSLTTAAAAATGSALAMKTEPVRIQLAQSEALDRVGKYLASSELAHRMVAKASELRDRSLEAEALYDWGHAELKLGHLPTAQQALEQAALAAEASGGLDELQAKCWLALTFLSGSLQGRVDEGHRSAQHAAALIERLGFPVDLELELHRALATLAAMQKQTPVALSENQKALELSKRLGQPNQLVVATALDNLGALHQKLGQQREAAGYWQLALVIWEKALGPAHPEVASSLNHLGEAYQRLGRSSEAVPLYERALAIHRQSLGEQTPAVAATLSHLAMAYAQLGRKHEAEDGFERSIALYERLMGSESSELVEPLENLGRLFMGNGEVARALPLFQRALTLSEKGGGTNDPGNAGILANIGEAWLLQRKPGSALAPLEQALRLRETDSSRSAELASIRYLLSRALWESGRDRVRAKRLALLAWEDFQSVEEKLEEKGRLEAWLTRRGWHSFASGSWSTAARDAAQR